MILGPPNLRICTFLNECCYLLAVCRGSVFFRTLMGLLVESWSKGKPASDFSWCHDGAAIGRNVFLCFCSSYIHMSSCLSRANSRSFQIRVSRRPGNTNIMGCYIKALCHTFSLFTHLSTHFILSMCEGLLPEVLGLFQGQNWDQCLRGIFLPLE